MDAGARAAGHRILGTGLWDYLTITLPLAAVSNVLAFDEIRLERVADMTLWATASSVTRASAGRPRPPAPVS